MKAICVSKGLFHHITVGKTYEALQRADGRWAVIDDDGDLEYWILEERFRPVPDPVPEPVNEWMQIDRYSFINMKTGMAIEFGDGANDCSITVAGGHWRSFDQYAESFAQMVGYKWEE